MPSGAYSKPSTICLCPQLYLPRGWVRVFMHSWVPKAPLVLGIALKVAAWPRDCLGITTALLAFQETSLLGWELLIWPQSGWIWPKVSGFSRTLTCRSCWVWGPGSTFLYPGLVSQPTRCGKREGERSHPPVLALFHLETLLRAQGKRFPGGHQTHCARDTSWHSPSDFLFYLDVIQNQPSPTRKTKVVPT